MEKLVRRASRRTSSRRTTSAATAASPGFSAQEGWIVSPAVRKRLRGLTIPSKAIKFKPFVQGIKWDGKSPFIPKAAADVAALQQMMNTAMNLKIDKMFDWKKVEARMFETLGMDVSSVLENPAAWLDEYEAERGKIL